MQNKVQLKNDPSSASEACDRNYSKFVIVSHARSGSNLLLNSLNSHPNIIAEHEIFAAHNRNIGENFQPTLDNLYRERPVSAEAVGCKIFYYHLNEDEWRQLSEIPELKVIHLKRKNRLSMIVSMKVAFKTSQWGITKESERIDVAKKQVYLDYDYLCNSFNDIESWERNTQELFGDSQVKNIFYEDLVSRYDESIKALFDFLAVPEIPPSEIKTKHKKQNPEPLSQLIQNYDELKAKFAGTPWSHYFND
ncbi:MAG: sulfotransferase domain-containing protein [Cyanobacteria bacterium P01_A01_bin.40]